MPTRIQGPLEIVVPSENDPHLKLLKYDLSPIGSPIQMVNPDTSVLDLSPNPNVMAESMGYIAFPGGDPGMYFQTALDTSGSIHGTGVWLPRGAVITKLANLVAVVGVAVTHGIIGLFDSNFNLLAQTADVTAPYQSTGWVELSLTAPYTILRSGWYYVADLLAAGTTMPSMGNYGSLATTNARSQLPNGIYRFFSQIGPFTAFPAQLTPAISGLIRGFLVR